MRLEFIGVNTNKLHDELKLSNVVPKLVESNEIKTWITIDDSQEEAVRAVVALHDPTPLPPFPTKEELLEMEVAELWYQNMMLDFKVDEETALLWYELMIGGM